MGAREAQAMFGGRVVSSRLRSAAPRCALRFLFGDESRRTAIQPASLGCASLRAPLSFRRRIAEDPRFSRLRSAAPRCALRLRGVASRSTTSILARETGGRVPGKVIPVQRRERLGWFERAYLPAIISGF